MKINELVITRFNPENAIDAEFDDAVHLQIESFKENNPHDPLPPKHMLRKNMEMIAQHPMFNVEIYFAKNKAGELLGGMYVLLGKPDSPDYDNQKHMAMLEPIVLLDYRRQGIGTELLKFGVTRLGQDDGISLVQADTNRDAGRAFANSLGAEIAIESRDNRAQVAELNWEMIEAWAVEGEKNNLDVVVEFFTGLPDDDDLEAYSQLYTEVFNQQPFEELEGLEMSWTPERLRETHARMQELGTTDYVMFSREPNGDLSGMTEMAYNPERSHRVGQGLTGVQENYRGRGIGKWLKAKMLLYMRETFPTVEHIATTNASSNAAMLSINERLGFKVYKHNTAFKIQLDDLAQQLGI